MTERGQYAKGVARREEILRVALELFSTDGYRGTSLREVARRVGMSLPGLIHHFDSKEQLLIEILRARDIADYPVSSAAGDDLAGLIRIMQHNRTVPGLVELYLTMAAASADESHPAREFFRERIPGVVRGIAEAIRERQRAGEVAADLDPDHLSRVMVALADGMQVQWILDSEIDMSQDIARAWEMLTARPGSL